MWQDRCIFPLVRDLAIQLWSKRTCLRRELHLVALKVRLVANQLIFFNLEILRIEGFRQLPDVQGGSGAFHGQAATVLRSAVTFIREFEPRMPRAGRRPVPSWTDGSSRTPTNTQTCARRGQSIEAGATTNRRPGRTGAAAPSGMAEWYVGGTCHGVRMKNRRDPMHHHSDTANYGNDLDQT